MTALYGAFAVMLAMIAAATWVIAIVRADGRERSAALVLAEQKQGEANLAMSQATREVATLAADLRRQQRRADALEDFIRGDLIRRHGMVDDGTDLLLAELGIVADGPDDEAETAPGPRSRTVTGGTVFVDPAGVAAAAAGGGERAAAADGDVPDGEAP